MHGFPWSNHSWMRSSTEIGLALKQQMAPAILVHISPLPSSSLTFTINSPSRAKSTSIIFIGPYLVLLQTLMIQSFQYVVFVSGAQDLSHIILPLQYRYIQLSRCVHQFRHIMLIKCSRLGHSPLPLSSSSLGSCAVECPCCPHPGPNIPDSWHYVNPENKYVASNFPDCPV